MCAKRQDNQLELAFKKKSRGEALRGLVEGTEVCVVRADTERPATGWMRPLGVPTVVDRFIQLIKLTET